MSQKLKLPTAAQIKAGKEAFDVYCENTPWQDDGDRILKPVFKNIRKYMDIFAKIPDDMGLFFDAYLAAVYHKNANRGGQFGNQRWKYHSFEVVEEYGKDLFLCRDEEENEFVLKSNSVTINLDEGHVLFFSVLVDMGGWFMTYGPVLGFKGLLPLDIVQLARLVAPQMLKQGGLHSVVMFSPLAFWSMVNLCEIPPVFHGETFVENITWKGHLKEGSEISLPSTWQKSVAGANTRWIYKKDDFFHRQYIYFNEKKNEMYLSASNPLDFSKLCKKAESFFEPDEDAFSMSMLMETHVELATGKKPLSVSLDSRFVD